MPAETTLDERLAPIEDAVAQIKKIDFKTAVASPEATFALISGAAVVFAAFAESMVRLANAAEINAKAAADLADLAVRKDRRI